MSSHQHQYEKFVMPESRVVSLPGRHPRLPIIYEYEEHPLVPASNKQNGRIYVYVHDTSEEGNLSYYEFAKELVFPDGTEEAVTSAGFLKLKPGDFVLARDAHGSGEEQDDHPVVWVTGGDSLPDGMAKSLENLQKDILGPDELIDAEKARKVDGVWRGGIRWERSDYAVNIAASERCYTVAQSYQIQRNLTSPAVGAKVYGDPTDHHELRKKIIETAAPVALASLQRAPPAYVQTMELQAEVNNLPRIGNENNVVSPTMQLNIASTKSHDSLAADQFSRDLGQFAGKHVDEHDSAGAYTCMISMNRLSENDSPGYFMADLGVAIEQRGIITTCFSGLHFHGGFPPTAPPGETPDKTSYRCVIVCYPPRASMDGDSMIGFGALPEGKLFSLPPEMTNALFDNQTFSTNCANWLSEGLTLTNDRAFLNWYYRALCQLINFFNRQVPASGRPTFDVAKFRECLSMPPTDARPATLLPEPWPLAPGIDDATAAARAEVVKRWQEHKDRVSSFIPHVVHVRHEKAEREREENEREERAKREKRSKGGAKQLPKAHGVKRGRQDGEEHDEDDGIPVQKKAKKAEHDARAHGNRPAPLKKRKSKQKAHSSPAEVQSDLDVDDSVPSSEPPRKRQQLACVEISTLPPHIRARSDAHQRVLGGSGKGNTTKYSLRSVTYLSDDNESFEPESEEGVLPEVTKCGLPRLPEPSNDSDEDESDSGDDDSDLPRDTALALSANSSESAGGPGAPRSQRDPPCYQKLLDSFCEANLIPLLSKLETMASKTLLLSGSDSDVDGFLARWRAETPGCISGDFARSVSRMWTVHRVRESTANVFELNIALERRRLMLCNAAGWTWLTVSCADAARAIVADMVCDRDAYQGSSDWFQRLVRDIFLIVRSRKSGVICCRDYFPDLVVTASSTRVAAPRTTKDTVAEVVTKNLVSILESWLNFPTRAQRFAAYFVIYLLQTIPNEDILLLPLIWEAHQHIKVRILGHHPGRRASSMKVSDFAPFVAALQAHPIASPTSREAELLRRISAARVRCMPSLQQVSSALCSVLPETEARAPSTPSPAQPNMSTPGTATSSAGATAHSARVASSSGVAVPSPALVSAEEQGLRDFARFLRDAMAVVRDPSSHSFTSLQKRIASNLDRFLPMREHGRSRIKVQAPGGAFHPEIIDLPGGFASCVLTRSHLFNSPLLLTLRPSSHYSSLEEWRNTLLLHGYNRTAAEDTVKRKSLLGVLNMSSYGQPQVQRFDNAWTDPENYFLQEANFRTMWQQAQNTNSDDPEDKKIRFSDFLGWIYAVDQEDNKLFPLCGSLTGYLLTADFVYAGRVACPSLDEVAGVIHRMKLGSWRGLKAIGQPLPPRASRADVAACFRFIFNALEKVFSEEERTWMVFDPIMVEHALCKYQRIVD